MDIFTVRDLREKTGLLIRDAEEGKMSLITKHGHPVFIALPFKEELIEWGIATALAINLYKEGIVSLSQAAKYSGLSLEEFMERLGILEIPVINYSEEELVKEINSFSSSMKSNFPNKPKNENKA